MFIFFLSYLPASYFRFPRFLFMLLMTIGYCIISEYKQEMEIVLPGYIMCMYFTIRILVSVGSKRKLFFLVTCVYFIIGLLAIVNRMCKAYFLVTWRCMIRSCV